MRKICHNVGCLCASTVIQFDPQTLYLPQKDNRRSKNSSISTLAPFSYRQNSENTEKLNYKHSNLEKISCKFWQNWDWSLTSLSLITVSFKNTIPKHSQRIRLDNEFCWHYKCHQPSKLTFFRFLDNKFPIVFTFCPPILNSISTISTIQNGPDVQIVFFLDTSFFL